MLCQRSHRIDPLVDQVQDRWDCMPDLWDAVLFTISVVTERVEPGPTTVSEMLAFVSSGFDIISAALQIGKGKSSSPRTVARAILRRICEYERPCGGRGILARMDSAILGQIG